MDGKDITDMKLILNDDSSANNEKILQKVRT
jgi:hypothetical protein